MSRGHRVMTVETQRIFFNYLSFSVKKICAGDVIIAVNGDSFINMSHEDAVRYLSSLRGSIRFELQNTIEADIEAVCDMESRYYDLYDVRFYILITSSHCTVMVNQEPVLSSYVEKFPQQLLVILVVHRVANQLSPGDDLAYNK